MSLLTSTIAVAGRIAPKISPWTRAMGSHWRMSVTYIRVRTTWCRPLFSSRSAASMISKIRLVWAAGSPRPTTPPGP